MAIGHAIHRYLSSRPAFQIVPVNDLEADVGSLADDPLYRAGASDPAHLRCRAARHAALESGQTLVTTDFVVDEPPTLIRLRLLVHGLHEFCDHA